MKYLSIFVILAFLLILTQCGGSKLEEGDANYAEGKYTQAINSYLAHKKSNPESNDINAKIALAYFNKGKQLFARSKNIDAYSGNYEKAQNYLDSNSFTPEQKTEYSALLYDLATSYYKTKPNNDIQKEQYFNNTLDYLALAIENDPNNAAADSMLNSIYMENFQKMFDEGLKFFNQAKKERKNPDLYVSAESYFKQAVKFNPEHEEAAKYLNDTRKQTLGILQNIYPFSFCVPNYQIQKSTCFVALAAKNFSKETIKFDLNALTLNTVDGQVINFDPKKTGELEKGLQENVDMKEWALLDGQVAFTVDPKVELDFISYKVDDKRTVKKYFSRKM